MRMAWFGTWVDLCVALSLAGVSACVPRGRLAVDPPPSGALRVAAVFGDAAGRLGGPVLAVAISGDGRTGAIGGDEVEVFEIPSLRRLAYFPELNSRNGALALSPDGSLVVACSRRGAEIWSVRKRRRLAKVRAPWPVYAAAFSRQGGLLALGGGDFGIGIWNVARKRWTWRKQERVIGEVRSLQFSDDDRLLLSATKIGLAQGDPAEIENWFRSPRVWEAASGSQVAALANSISPAAWTNDARFVIGGGTGAAQVWDRASGRRIAKLTHYDSLQLRREPHVLGVALSPDGARAYTTGEDGTLAVWDVAAQREIRRIAAHQEIVDALAVSRDGRYALTGSRDGRGRLWDLQSFEEIGRKLGHHAGVGALAVSADGRELYSVSADGRALGWALPDGQPVGNGAVWDHWAPADSGLRTGWGRSVSVGLARHGTVVVGAERNRAFAVDRATGRILWEREVTRTLQLAAGPASDRVVAFSDYPAIMVGLDSGETRLPLKEGARVLAISPDERLMALANRGDGALWLADVRDGAEVRRLAGHGASEKLVTGIGTMEKVQVPHSAAVSGAFRSDGAVLATSGWDHALRFWSVATGAPLGAVWMPIADSPALAVFSPDGRWVAAGTDETGKLFLIDGNSFALVGSLSLGEAPGLTGTRIQSLTFSPDSRTVYAGTARGAIVAISIAAARQGPLGPRARGL